MASVFDLDEGLVDLLLSLQVSVDPWLEDHGTKFRASLLSVLGPSVIAMVLSVTKIRAYF